MFETVSIPVYASIASDSAKIVLLHVGTCPRSTWWTSSDGLRIRIAPSMMISTWVARSSTARMKLSFADSPIPRMFSAASPMITTIPPITSPGGWCSAGQNALR